MHSEQRLRNLRERRRCLREYELSGSTKRLRNDQLDFTRLGDVGGAAGLPEKQPRERNQRPSRARRETASAARIGICLCGRRGRGCRRNGRGRCRDGRALAARTAIASRAIAVGRAGAQTRRSAARKRRTRSCSRHHGCGCVAGARACLAASARLGAGLRCRCILALRCIRAITTAADCRVARARVRRPRELLRSQECTRPAGRSRRTLHIGRYRR